MSKFKISTKAQRFWASVLHIVFAVIALLGMGMLYANPNFGRGVNNIGKIAYEDTEEFNEQIEESLADIFTYIKYSDIFGTDGKVEIDQVLLRMTFGPDDTEDVTLADMLTYLKDKGYSVDGTFECKKTKEDVPYQGMGKDQQGYLEWSILQPELEFSFMDKNVVRIEKEKMAVDIMDLLHSYSVAYSQLFSGNSNLHFKIEYKDGPGNSSGITYTNDENLTRENIKTFGKYASISGNSVFYDTNLSGIALNTVSALSACNPFSGSEYSLLVGVDTDYPYKDSLYQGRERYIKNQYYYILGSILLIAGGIMTFISLVYLLMASTKNVRNQKEGALSGFDKSATEVAIVGILLTTVLAYKFMPLLTNRFIHPLFENSIWYLLEKMVSVMIVYLGVIILLITLTRRYFAGLLKERSLIYKAARSWRRQISTGTPMLRTAVGYFGHVLINLLVVSAAWLVLRENYFKRSYKLGFLTVIGAFFVISNLWGFYMRYRRAVMRNELIKAVAHLKEGDTGFRIDTEDFDGPEYELAVDINNVGAGLETALNEKVKSERLKADLITNVSHDIKTPLTSIINYVDLLKREKTDNPAVEHYLEVLDQKSMRLKILIEDLVEASKASSGNVKLEMTTLELGEMIEQTNGEFEEKFAERGLTIIMGRADRPLPIYADGRRLWRILENLYNNTFKYALQDSRVYVNCDYVEDENGDYARFTIKNISDKPLNISPEELTERFVRGDVSRTTEGSGLGLSIAKSLTELMSGSFKIVIDGDLFKGVLTFPVVNQ